MCLFCDLLLNAPSSRKRNVAPSSRKRLEESWFFLLKGEAPLAGLPLLKKSVPRTLFQFTPFESLRMQGISPSAEGDQGALPLDPASAQVGAGPALDTLADFYSFVVKRTNQLSFKVHAVCN